MVFSLFICSAEMIAVVDQQEVNHQQHLINHLKGYSRYLVLHFHEDGAGLVRDRF